MKEGLDFYDRLVDGCKARGIKTYAALYRWDLPLTLMGDGGWTARSTAYAFQRYARTVMEHAWATGWTLLPPLTSRGARYGDSHLYGIHAPGERNMDAALAAMHYTNLAHGLGVQTCRDVAPKRAGRFGTERHSVIAASDSAADKAAAERAFQFHNGVFFGPVFKGEYPSDFVEALGDRMPVVEEGDLTIINAETRLVGIELLHTNAGCR